MYTQTTQMDPLFPSNSDKLSDLAISIIRDSATLGGQLHPITRTTIINLLRIINSYYSNRIEGHCITPIDIERAMQNDYVDDSTQRALQIESRIHIEVQQEIESRLNTETTLNITDVDFITFIHRQFYKHLPKTLKGNVKAGALRTQEVKVGRHIPPLSETLPLFLERFSQFYSRHHFQESDAVIAAAAAHHRLTWIHPFVDGNGRVVRLFTEAYLQNLNFCKKSSFCI